MRETRDALFTVVNDQDLHDHGFKCVHYLFNSHIDLTIPVNRYDYRTIHLGAHQCLLWGYRLIRFHNDIITADPEREIDYQI